jgi:hypothetical protein
MKVMLMTQEVVRNLPPLYSQEGKDPAAVRVAVKFFTPDAQCTWYVTEGERDGGDWRFFGLCDLGQGFPELGYVQLSELQSVRGQLGLPVERDRHYTGTLAEAMAECHYHELQAA